MILEANDGVNYCDYILSTTSMVITLARWDFHMKWLSDVVHVLEHLSSGASNGTNFNAHQYERLKETGGMQEYQKYADL
jgi:hypothetical protein